MLIGITGASCAGKSTLCQNIKALTHSPVLSTDDFFKQIDDYVIKPDGEIDFDHIDNILWDELIHCLQELNNGQTASVPIYVKGPGKGRVGYRTVEPHPIILVEGYLLFRNPLVKNLIPREQRVFIDLPLELQRQRRYQVYGSFEAPSYFTETVHPMFEREVMPQRQEVTHILDGSVSELKLAEEFLSIFNINNED